MNELESKLQKLADELNISEAKYNDAVDSYNAIGTYLSNHLGVEIKVFPQGSFRLGTVIKPLSDSDGDYDIDLVCIVGKAFDNSSFGAQSLKNFIGDALKESSRYKDMLDPKEGGKRCWTIVYSNDYHLDILPTIKHVSYDKNKKLYMTNKITDNYFEFRTTNPEQYYDWFNLRNVERKKIIDEACRDSIVEKVPEYKIRTTLQKTIQVIKRYRDIMFKDEYDDRPISIILTTILASIYNGETSIVSLIRSFINKVHQALTQDDLGNYVIKNPVNSDENFADKWIENPKRKQNFFKLVDSLNQNFFTEENNLLLESRSRLKIADSLKTMFGDSIINRLYENEGVKAKTDREHGSLHISNEGRISNEPGTKIKDHTFHGED